MRHVRFSFPNPRRDGTSKWPVSWIIIAITVLWYIVVESICGHSAYGLVRSGAMVNTLVLHGQLFRVLSALFVHVTTMHLLVNMVSLWTLTVVETLLGANVFVTVYIISGLVGNLLGMVFIQPTVVSAGASGAIFGLFGVMLALAMMKILPPIVRNQLLLMLAINVVLDFSNRNIDWLAHLGGMLTGVLLTLMFLKGARNPKVWRLTALSSAFLTAICLVIALFSPIPVTA